MICSVFFTQGCPTCGRNLRVDIQYVESEVACQHCRAAFVARDPGQKKSHDPLLHRANELLAMTS